MTKQCETHFRLSAALVGSLAVVVVGALGPSADAAPLNFQSGTNGTGGTYSWLDQLTENGPSSSAPLPGGFNVENGEDPPPPDYRAHSDVPDLPDGTDPTATSGGGSSLYGAPDQPNLSDTFDTGISDVLSGSRTMLPYDDGGSGAALPPSASTIPGPASVLLFGAAGLGAIGRRRRR